MKPQRGEDLERGTMYTENEKLGEAVGGSEKQGVLKTSGGEVLQKTRPQQSEWYRERSGQVANEESFGD